MVNVENQQKVKERQILMRKSEFIERVVLLSCPRSETSLPLVYLCPGARI